MGESAVKFKRKRASWERCNAWESNALGYFGHTGAHAGRRGGRQDARNVLAPR